MIDPKHLTKNNETYLSHFFFAAKIGFYFLISGVYFVFHSVVPWLTIPRSMNLEATCAKVKFWNQYAESRRFDNEK